MLAAWLSAIGFAVAVIWGLSKAIPRLRKSWGGSSSYVRSQSSRRSRA